MPPASEPLAVAVARLYATFLESRAVELEQEASELASRAAQYEKLRQALRVRVLKNRSRAAYIAALQERARAAALIAKAVIGHRLHLDVTRPPSAASYEAAGVAESRRNCSSGASARD